MAKPIQTNDQTESDPRDNDTVHRAHAAGTGRENAASSGDPQPHVPDGDTGDPTRDSWSDIDEGKVQTAKEEMPAPGPATR